MSVKAPHRYQTSLDVVPLRAGVKKSPGTFQSSAVVFAVFLLKILFLLSNFWIYVFSYLISKSMFMVIKCFIFERIGCNSTKICKTRWLTNPFWSFYKFIFGLLCFDSWIEGNSPVLQSWNVFKSSPIMSQ